MPADVTVCVTGASGFIAGQTIRELLANGFSVRGTVRGEIDDPQYAYLKQLPGAAERLELVPGDLAQSGSFLGKTMCISNANICAELGVEFRPVRETLVDVVGDLIRQGHLQKFGN
ncbi:hypothetical protein A9Q88_03785 [Gammaproteobacteria bacterium 50_400_T64]|nr:hypothetical protein A9Q88_03785 [Gammaproteobacteria bacterium 50_400_T64]